MMTARFQVTISRCAQKCAHTDRCKHASRIAELIVDARVIGKATVFQKRPSKVACAKKIRVIRKYLRTLYLSERGEVAERLKAAVC
jgi:hypothetical protein